MRMAAMPSNMLPEMTPRGEGRFPLPEDHFVRKVLFLALVAGLCLVLWQVSRVAILTFAGALLAVALRNMSAPLQRYLRLPAPWALLIATLFFCGALAGLIDLFGTLAFQQLIAIYHQIPSAVKDFQIWLMGMPMGRQIIAALPHTEEGLFRLLQAVPLAGGFLGAVGEGLLVLAVGVYFAADPKTYTEGVLHLIPKARRWRAREILNAMGVALKQWLLGMSVDMVLLGGMVFFGMWAIGMPYPLALAVLSGGAVFVPYIGPALAVIPGLLLALGLGPQMFWLATAVYVVALTIEGNFSQPMLQRWAVSIPPVVNLLAILVFSPLFGIWGAVLATPLSVTLWVLVKMVYVEDVLKDRDPPDVAA